MAGEGEETFARWRRERVLREERRVFERRDLRWRRDSTGFVSRRVGREECGLTLGPNCGHVVVKL
jgi:hypothetical protein